MTLFAIPQKIFKQKNLILVRTLCSSLLIPPLEQLQLDSHFILTSLKSYTVCHALLEGRILHAYMISFQILNVSLWNALITMYGKCGSLDEALNTFDHMAAHNVISWNALIAVFILHGYYEEALLYFRRMQEEAMQPDNVTCISVVSACANQRLLEEGMNTHNLALLFGYDTDMGLSNALIHMYGRCGSLEAALSVFRASSQDDIISWNAMISAYSFHFVDSVAQHLYNEMLMKAMVPNRVSYVSILSLYANMRAFVDGRWIHAILIGSDFEFEAVLGTTLINLYGKCGSLSDARKVFDQMTNPNTVSWNALIAVHAQNEERGLARQLFGRMHQENFISSKLTFVSILDSCENMSSLHEGKRLHVMLQGKNLEKDIVVGNALVNMYGKCQSISTALELFDGMPQRNELTWNIMITKCVQSDYGVKALDLFSHMLQEASLPDKVTFIAILDACVHQLDLTTGVRIHASVVGSHLVLDNAIGIALLNMYSKCGRMPFALEMFDMLLECNVVAWSALISGYAQQGESGEALFCFNRMCQEGVMPNKITYVSALAVCVSHGVLLAGKRIHAVVVGCELGADVVIANALINLYGKIGCLDDARGIFDSMRERDAISWSAMIAAYAQHGEEKDVLRLFYRMQQVGIKPNNVTFCSVISAWGHTGKVEEGYYWFLLMDRGFNIPPGEDHYNCMIDLSGRAGRLDEAEKLLAHMSSQITIISIMALLSACKYQSDVERGECFARHAFTLFPENMEPHVMLANIYYSAGRVEDAERVFGLMKNKGPEGYLIST